MKLKTLLLDGIFADATTQNIPGITDNSISGKELEKVKDILQQCDEFKDCELIILDKPSTEDTEGKPYFVSTMKMAEDTKFKQKVFLYGLYLSPERYDPLKIDKAVKDGCSIGPVMYNPIDFTPKRAIRIEFSPEQLQDDIAVNHEERNIRQELHEKLDKILDNPEEYKIKGDRAVMIRGLFESYSMDGEESTIKDYSNLLSNVEKPNNYMVFYINKKQKENSEDISVSFEHIFIPSVLKDKFMAELGDKKLNVTKEEIEKFLEDNK